MFVCIELVIIRKKIRSEIHDAKHGPFNISGTEKEEIIAIKEAESIMILPAYQLTKGIEPTKPMCLYFLKSYFFEMGLTQRQWNFRRIM